MPSQILMRQKANKTQPDFQIRMDFSVCPFKKAELQVHHSAKNKIKFQLLLTPIRETYSFQPNFSFYGSNQHHDSMLQIN